MRAYVVSDNEAMSPVVRQGLTRHGYECPPTHVLAIELALPFLLQVEVDLVVVVLPPSPERALEVLAGLRAHGPLPVLAVGPATDARLVLRTLRGGASEYLDEADLDAELEVGLVRALHGPHANVPKGKVIALLGAGGGCGVSTLAVNLAAALAQGRSGALLIDLRLETGDLATLLDLKPAHSLADICQHAGELDRSLFERSLARHPGGVHLLAAPRSPADVPYVTPEGVRQAVALGASLFPHAILDLGHPSHPEQAQALRQADAVLVVLRLDFTCLRNARRLIEQMGELGVAAERVRLVVNRLGQSREVPADRAEQALGMKFAHRIPDDPRTVNRANNNGTPAILDSPSARVCRAMSQLAADLAGTR